MGDFGFLQSVKWDEGKGMNIWQRTEMTGTGTFAWMGAVQKNQSYFIYYLEVGKKSLQAMMFKITQERQ